MAEEVEGPRVGAEIHGRGPAGHVVAQPQGVAFGAHPVEANRAVAGNRVVPVGALRQREEARLAQREPDRQELAGRDEVADRGGLDDAAIHRIRAEALGLGPTVAGGDAPERIEQERIGTLAPGARVGGRECARLTAGLAGRLEGPGADDVVAGAEAGSRAVARVTEADRQRDPRLLEEAVRLDRGAPRELVLRAAGAAALTHRKEVRPAAVPRQVVAHQVGQLPVDLDPLGVVHVLGHVGGPQLVEPQLSRAVARPALVQQPEGDAPEPGEGGPADDEEALPGGLAGHAVAVRVGLLEVRIQLEVGQVGELETDLVPGDLPRARVGRQARPVLIVVAPLLVRGEAHEVEQPGGRIAPDPGRVEQTKGRGVPGELAVAAVVLVQREGLEGLQRRAALEVGELQAHGLLAPGEFLAAVARLAGIERRHVDIGVVLRVHRVQGHRRDRRFERDRVELGLLPAAAHDIQPPQHEQGPGLVRGIRLHDALEPHAHALDQRLVGIPELHGQGVGDRDAVPAPAVVVPHLRRVEGVDVRHQVGSALGVVAQVDGVLGVVVAGVQRAIQVLVLGVGHGIDRAVALGAVHRDPVMRLDGLVHLSRHDVVRRVEVVALGVCVVRGDQVGPLVAHLVRVGIHQPIESRVLVHREYVVMGLVLGVQPVVGRPVRRAHLVLAHRAQVHVELDVAPAHAAPPAGVPVAEVVHPQLDELGAGKVESRRVEQVVHTRPQAGGIADPPPGWPARHAQAQHLVRIARALGIFEVGLEILLLDVVGRRVPVHLGVVETVDLEPRLHTRRRDRHLVPRRQLEQRHARPVPALLRHGQGDRVAHPLHVVDEDLVPGVGIGKRHSQLGLHVEIRRGGRADSRQAVHQPGRPARVERPFGVEVGDETARGLLPQPRP